MSVQTPVPFVWGSVDHQLKLFEALGYDCSQYDPKNDDEVAKVAKIALEAQISGKDASGKWLSVDDLRLLAAITGRN